MQLLGSELGPGRFARDARERGSVPVHLAAAVCLSSQLLRTLPTFRCQHPKTPPGPSASPVSSPFAPPSSNRADMVWNSGSTANVASPFLARRWSGVVSVASSSALPPP